MPAIKVKSARLRNSRAMVSRGVPAPAGGSAEFVFRLAPGSGSALRACALFMLLIACTAWADQVTLKNGDRVTGSIVKKDGNNLTVKSDLMGVVTIPWDQI